MKNLFVAIALLIPFLSFGTILTVDNSSSSPGQYTSFSSAYNAASAGDTIYVRGSLHSYGSITISKKITLIGAGYNPSPLNTYPTTFDDVNIAKYSSSSNASGTRVYGIKVNTGGEIDIRGGSYPGYITDIRIERCEAKFTSYYVSGLKLINNIILNYAVSTYTKGNTIIYNNIIRSITFSSSYNSNAITFDHNIFTNAASSVFRYCIVKNSIFYGTTPGNSATHTTFANNMAYASANDTFNITTNSNTGYNNFNHTNPNFVSVGSTTFSYFYDYHLQSGSPAINAGSDGTNLGIYGGLYPFPIGGASGSGYQTSQEPAIPQIFQFTIQNKTIQPTDTLNINIKVSIQK